MMNRLSTSIALGAILFFVAVIPAASGQPRCCHLDHFLIGHHDGKLFADYGQVYRHTFWSPPNTPPYELCWSPIYQRWSNYEPNFGNPILGCYGDMATKLVGTPNEDYQIWFEILGLSADFRIVVTATTPPVELTQVGNRYNLSDWNENHVHVKHCAYVPEHSSSNVCFYVTYRLVDDFGMYQPSEPFTCVFACVDCNNPPDEPPPCALAPMVESTTPPYRATLGSLADAELTFTFHREIVVEGGPPVTITDEETHMQDYYTGYFDFTVSPDGMTLILNQISGMLPGQTWLQASLTEHVKDANVEDQSAVPFTQFICTPLASDFDGDGDVDLDDFNIFVGCLNGPDVPVEPDCETADLDCDDDVDLASFAAFQTHFSGSA
ncbi:MAG: hypothetical protein KAY37_02655 [Phycisphaerae bacterium]|nr:hypothetical protein [Phycisphaerae bacterium]